MKKIKITKIILGNLVCIGAITPLLTSCDTQEEGVTKYTLYFSADPEHGHLEGDEQITVDEGTKWQDVTNKPTPKVDTDGFIFDDWYYKGKALQPEDVISSDMDIQARFKKAFTPDTDFEWATDGNEAKIVEFKGTETDVLIPTIHTEGGKDYRVTSIGDEAFKDNVTLSSVVIPELSFKTIGNSAFEGCTNLTSINFPKSLKTIGNSAFEATKLSSIVIPEGAETIGNGAFQECTNLSSVTFSNTVTSIGNSAFENCIGITSITFLNGITNIGNSAFEGCTNLNEMKYNSEYDNWKEIHFGNDWHSGCNVTFVNCTDGDYHVDPEEYTLNFTISGHGHLDGETSITVLEADKWKNVDKPTPVPDDPIEYYFDGWYHNNVALNDNDMILGSMDIEARFKLTHTPVTSFEWSLNEEKGEATVTKFIGSETDVVIPWRYVANGKQYIVTAIGDHAFQNNATVLSIRLPETITSIGNFAFDNCKNLQSINVPDSVTKMGSFAFAWCEHLQSISIPDGITIIESGTFEYLKSIKTISIPNSVKEIDNAAFSSCYGLTTVTLPNNLEIIGERAFSMCVGLTSFTFPHSIKKLEQDIIWGIESMNKVSYDGTVAEWTQVYADSSDRWHNFTYITKVYCSDGTFDLPPFPPH